MKTNVGITPLKRFFNLLKIDRQEILSIYVYALFHGILTLSLPIGIQAIINLISGGQMSTAWIVLVVFVIAGVALTGVMQIMQLSISENLQQKIFTRSSFEFAYRIPRMKLEAVEKSYIPELVNRFFDILSVQKGLSKILMDFSSASLQVLFGLVLLSLYHPFFILFSLVLILLGYLIFRYTAPNGLRTSIKESKYKYEVAHWLEELARAMETFKLAGRASLHLTRTDDVVSGYLKSRKAHFRTLLVQYINMVGFKVIIAAGLLVIGGLLVLNQQMNIGQFVASEIIIILVLNSVEKLILSMETIYDVLTAMEKIGNVTDIPLDHDKGSQLSLKNEPALSVRLRHLSYQFTMAQSPTLRQVDLDIEAGEKLILAGYNGSGKTVLLQVLAGLYEGYQGSVAYHGVPLGNWCREDLYTLIGNNLEREDIFRGTVEENISLGRPEVSMDQIHRLASIVGLEDFVESLPAGYHTTLVPEGKALPTSIQLGIKLARALAGDPKLILLEDDFNQLAEPYRTRFLEYLVQGPWTVVAISDDVAVSRLFDRAIVLDNGHILGEGKIDDLQDQPWFNDIFQTRTFPC
ncbi:ATP-binding cassette domain-containing protein [Pontibacter sp. G13]|uniref:peptidase domain-containing ABC transporter n=1 Tax=Pontibacter sp. G13 TaxID=3074898 RepID=UPI00288C1AC7|nr:ATP-binding cassette domain-containing protein [Pontibacter sp. G13]WNJ20023.1 ATP-binding cassette domain-containing protein [Pontibacter sp. G13]